jgi:hypothetical protein
MLKAVVSRRKDTSIFSSVLKPRESKGGIIETITSVVETREGAQIIIREGLPMQCREVRRGVLSPTVIRITVELIPVGFPGNTFAADGTQTAILVTVVDYTQRV